EAAGEQHAVVTLGDVVANHLLDHAGRVRRLREDRFREEEVAEVRRDRGVMWDREHWREREYEVRGRRASARVVRGDRARTGRGDAGIAVVGDDRTLTGAVRHRPGGIDAREVEAEPRYVQHLCPAAADGAAPPA